MTPALECHWITVAYDEAPILRGLDLTVGSGEALAILGPSGSGKSTLLSAVAGFVDPQDGRILIDGEVVAERTRSAPPEARDVGFVFQHYALWPHMTALDTVAYPLLRRGLHRNEARRDALELLDRLGLSHLAGRRPAQLSGGEQQRVGLARALARAPSLYLFDEPTAHLDTPLRASLADEMAQRRRELGAAAVYATHDAQEALAVADRVALLRDGQVVQVGTPTAVYSEPVDLWAARLTGPACQFPVCIDSRDCGVAVVRVGDETANVAVTGASGTTRGNMAVIIRPEWAHLGGPWAGSVRHVAYRGPHTDYRIDTAVGDVDVRGTGAPAASVGEHVTWGLERVWLAPHDDQYAPAS